MLLRLTLSINNPDMSFSHPVGSQGEEFLRGEADAWFARNQHAKVAPWRRLLSEWCAPHKSAVGQILEIGAGNGLPLAFLSDVLDADGVGIEPSKQAVENWATLCHEVVGGARVSMRFGLASELPFEHKTFDLVIFGMSLCLVDRSLLYRAIAEADRVLRDGGLLCIEDFDATTPFSNPWHHKEGLYCFKSNYSNIYLSSGHYHLISKQSFSHSEPHSAFQFISDLDERVSLSLLYKQENDVYVASRPVRPTTP